MKRAAAAVMAVCLLLAACGRREENVLQSANGEERETTLLMVDGREVPAWQYFYWLGQACLRAEEQYRLAGASIDWDSADGAALAEHIKQQALEDTALYATVENWATEVGCTLSEEEWAALEAEEQEAADQAGGNEAYAKSLERLGLTPQRKLALAAVGALYAKLFQSACNPEDPLYPGQEALTAFADACGYVTLQHLQISAEEDRAAARERAEAAFSVLNGAADQADWFRRAAEEAGQTVEETTLTPGAQQLPASVEEAARALEVGACSGILESEEGFSILRRAETDTTGLAGEYFDTSLQETASQAVIRVQEAYGEIDVPAFYEALLKS